MDEEMEALASRGSRELLSAPTYTAVVGCRWVFTLKYHPDGSVYRYKVRLVAKGYTQTYVIDYFETFSLVARMTSIRILFFIAVNLSWPLFQLNVRNAFLYGDLQEEVYMEQPPGYVAQGEQKFFISRRPYMDSSRVQGHGLRSSTLPFLLLDFTGVIQITLSSFGAQSLAS